MAGLCDYALCDYATRPLAFVFRYVRLRPLSHAVILAAVLSADRRTRRYTLTVSASLLEN